MKIVIQRVTQASVMIDCKLKSEIKNGLLILLGITETDASDDVQWLCSKIINLRVFNDSNQVMNLSLKDVDADVLLVSQFTLYASTKKGNRPSYINAAKPEIAIPLYENFISTLQKELNKPIYTGVFGADMKVSLTNDGPVTIIMDSKNRE
jgi:D-tyrosyl-tRNA(Tyr) deacylase